MSRYRRYEKYKDSGVEWLGEIPEHWKSSKLKFISKIIDCKNRTPEYFNNGEYFVVRTTNIKNGKLLTSDAYYTDEENYRTWTKRGVPPQGSILFTREAPAGESCLVPKNTKLCLGQRVMNFIPQKNSLSEYIQFFLSTKQFFNFIESQSSGSTVTHLRVEQIYNINILKPPLKEQKTIARFLDYKTKQIDSLISKQETLLEKLDEKRTALISHAVTKGLDPTVPMKDSGIEWLGEIPAHWDLMMLRLRYSIELGKMLDQRRISGNYSVKYLRNVDVQWDFINQEDLPEMDIHPYEYERYLVKEGDLLVCEGGESGRSAIAQFAEFTLGFQKAIHRLRPIGSKEVPRYLLYVFYYLAKLGVFVAEGNPNTITHLTSEKLKSYKLQKPSRKEQIIIVDYLDQKTLEIDQQKATIQSAIALLKEYRTALITNAVTGKIDVRQVLIP